MAKSEIKVQISVETILQKALIDVAEKVLKEHGSRLNYVNFEWVNMSTCSETIMKVDHCEISTTYHRK